MQGPTVYGLSKLCLNGADCATGLIDADKPAGQRMKMNAGYTYVGNEGTGRDSG